LQIFERGHYPEAFVRLVTDGYLKTAGIPLIVGRDFTERDTAESHPAAMINETLARNLWPGQNPIGQILNLDGGRQVVGVVAGVRHRVLEETAGCELYFPMRQRTGISGPELVIRTRLLPSELASTPRTALKTVEPILAANEFRTLQQLVDKAASPRRFVVFYSPDSRPSR
jgi:MacB-like periplasmic core domain